MFALEDLLFALEDTDEVGHWGTFWQFHELAERSLRMLMNVLIWDLPNVA